MVKSVPGTHPTVAKLFRNRKIAITNTHGTELAIRPLIKQYLNLEAVKVAPPNCVKKKGIESSQEGSVHSVTALRKSILKALDASGQTLGIGNHGSYRPHPHLHSLHINQEVVMLIDLENDIEFFETVVSTESRYAQRQINDLDDLYELAEKIQFPAQGITLKELENSIVIKEQKGIMSWDILHDYFKQWKSREPNTQLIAENDMHTFLNPIRMCTVTRATRLLLKKILKMCPECQSLSFEQNKAPVSTINPTHSKLYQCKNCDHIGERYYINASNDENIISL